MRNKFFTSTTLLALILFAAAVFAQSGAHTVLVEVSNRSGQPLKRTCVTLIPRAGEVLFGQTDKMGRIKWKNIAPGNYRVVVKVDGYVAQKKEFLLSSRDETVAFSLEPRKER